MSDEREVREGELTEILKGKVVESITVDEYPEEEADAMSNVEHTIVRFTDGSVFTAKHRFATYTGETGFVTYHFKDAPR
jgi:hypothetical protein